MFRFAACDKFPRAIPGRKHRAFFFPGHPEPHPDIAKDATASFRSGSGRRSGGPRIRNHALPHGTRLARALRGSASAFHQAKRVAILGLTLSLLMWLIAFLAVGGEWFLMWQSKNWNGQDAAFRMFAVIGIVLVILMQADTEEQP